MGFRGERKRILTPSLSQGEGVCSDGEAKETSPLLTYPAVAGYLNEGEFGDRKRKKPPPSLLQRGSVVTGKGEK